MKILLVYPPLGVFGTYILHPPLSLLYLSIEVVKAGHEVSIFDCRLYEDWRDRLTVHLKSKDWDIVGVSVMAGLPVKTGNDISAMAKECTEAVVLWGGPYPTILPQESLGLDHVDMVIRGYAIRPFAKLVDALEKGEPYDVPGLCYRKNGEDIFGEINAEFEIYSFRDLPFHLIEENLERYINSNNQRTFPIFTVAGCPYNCAFCICPAWYKSLSKRWVSYPLEDIVEYIRFLHDEWGIELVYIYDDDTFVNKEHFRAIALRVMEEGLDVKFGIRGFRVNELDSLDDAYLEFLAKAGISYLHIGAESGSDRVLEIMGKGITVEQIIRVNRKLINHPSLIPFYNFLSGVPGETVEDLKSTKDLILQLTRENKNAVIFGPAKFIPYPGTRMYEDALKYGFVPPTTPEGWAALDQESDVWMPWYTDDFHSYINMLFLAVNVVDHKDLLIASYPWPVRLFFGLCKWAYWPIAKLRLRYDYSGFLFERKLYEWASKMFMFLGKKLSKDDVRD